MMIRRDGVNGLPTELLCNIFLLAIDSRYPKKDRCRLMLVCVRWRESVECSPYLWTAVRMTEGLPYVRRALERSKGLMVDIWCPLSMRFAAQLEAFMAEAGPHITRWRSLLVGFPRSAPPPENALGPLITAQAPSLETLTLRASSDYVPFRTNAGNALILFGGSPAPATLKNLILLRIPVAFEPLRLSGLVSLDLGTVKTISTPQLLEILRGSPGLTTLSLSDNPGLTVIETGASNVQTIELPELVSLSLQRIDDGATYCIFSNIRIPNRLSVCIYNRISSFNTQPSLFTPAITHILHTTIHTTDAPPSVIRVYERDGGTCMIQFRGIKLDLLRVDGEDQVQECLRWLVDGLGSEAAECPVHLILDSSNADSVGLAAVPHPLIVKHLSISDSMSVSLRLALYNAMVRGPGPAPFDWLLPQIESLSVRFATMESQKRLVFMLRSWYERATSTSETEPRCPMNMRSIELRGQPRTERLVEEIRGILGEADVLWAN